MAHTLTEDATNFAPTVTVPDGTDSAAGRASDVEDIAQAVADRTQYLYRHLRMQPLSTWLRQTPGTATDWWYGVASSAVAGSVRRWVAVGPSQAVYSTTLGQEAWIDCGTVPAQVFRDIAAGPSVYVVVGGNGASTGVIYTLDSLTVPTTWVSRTPGSSPADQLNAVTYLPFNTSFVACGNGGEFQTAPSTGVTWTQGTAAASVSHYDIDHDGVSRVVAVGGDIQYSDDFGSSWTQVALPTEMQYASGVAWNEKAQLWGLWGEASSSSALGAFATSPDGAVWTHRYLTDWSPALNHTRIAVCGRLWVIPTDSFGGPSTSDDNPRVLLADTAGYEAVPVYVGANSNEELACVATDGIRCVLGGNSAYLFRSLAQSSEDV